MIKNLLSSYITKLIESTSITLLQNIQSQKIVTPLNIQPITTTYSQEGESGTPILLLHGFDSSLLEFRRLIPLLAAKNETWAVDLLGFGFTERLLEIKFTPTDIKTHLYYFWKTLIQKPIILVGASMGGAAAIDFTLTYPEVVEKLVLIDSAGLKNGSVMSKFLFPPLDYLATAFLRNQKVREKVSQTAYYDQNFASIDAQLCAALHLEMPNWSQALIAFTKSGGYNSFGKQLSKINQKTLILWGKHDKILGINDAIQFQKKIPHSQLIWIEDCGHVPHLEKPQITAQEILHFIQD